MRELVDIRLLLGVFSRHADDVPILVDFDKDVFVEVVAGWLNYYGISHTYTGVLELSEWVRRRVRLYYWKQWKQPRTRRRHLLALGADPEEVHMASKGIQSSKERGEGARILHELRASYLLVYLASSSDYRYSINNHKIDI